MAGKASFFCKYNYIIKSCSQIVFRFYDITSVLESSLIVLAVWIAIKLFHLTEGGKISLIKIEAKMRFSLCNYVPIKTIS